MLLLVVPANHWGNGLPPGQLCPPPRTVKRTTGAPSAQLVYERRVTSVATTESPGFGAHRFLSAQLAVQVGMLGNLLVDIQVVPPLYGVIGSCVP